MFRGPPANDLDAAAQQHDFAYSQLLKNNQENPYVYWNTADDKFSSDISSDKSVAGNFARSVFHLKKSFLPHSTSDRTDLPLPPPLKKPKLADPAEPEAELPPESARGNRGPRPRGDLGAGPNSKRQRMSNPGGGGTDADPAAASLIPGDPHARNSWHNSTHWTSSTVTTAATRVFSLPTYDGGRYKKVALTTAQGNGANAYLGWSTPWGYVDYNRFHIHFSPKDWQKLVNTHSGFRPKRMRGRIFGLQLKEVTTTSQGTQIATSLSASLQVLVDKSNSLPYVMASANAGTLPPFPNDVIVLPQYAYTSLHGEGSAIPETSFFCLEGMDSSLIKTGEEISFEYAFPNVPFHSCYQVGQFLHQTANPLLDQYLFICHGTDNTGNIKWQRPGAGKFADMYQNYAQGPCLQFNVLNVRQPGKNPKNMSKDQWDAANPRIQVPNLGRLQTRPGVPMYVGKQGFTCPNNDVVFDVGNTRDPVGTSTSGYSIGDEGEVQYTNLGGAAVADNGSISSSCFVANNFTGATSMGNSAGIGERDIFPGMCWMDRDLYLSGQIWAKIPNTDGHFHPVPHMGGFGMAHPPPMIFLKNVPTPANPSPTWSEQYVQSFIAQYATAMITFEIEWELETGMTPRWNPQPQWGYTVNDAQTNKFLVDTNGKYTEGIAISSRWQTRPL